MHRLAFAIMTCEPKTFAEQLLRREFGCIVLHRPNNTDVRL